MTVAMLITLVVIAPLLILVTLVQMLFMDSVRLRPKDLPFLELFRQDISDRMNMKADEGILAFSLVKHTLLAVLGVVFAFLTATSELHPRQFFESLALSWLTMLGCTYIVPQALYRRTSGQWFLPMVPLVRVVAKAVRPLTGVLGFLQSLM